MMRTEPYNKTFAQSKADAALASITSNWWTPEIMLLIADYVDVCAYLDSIISEANKREVSANGEN